MKSITSILGEKLADRDTRFVFPSAVPAMFWAEEMAKTSGTAVATDRFIAWDEFKAETLSEDHHDRRPCNGAARNIFAASLLAENARAPFLREILPPAHADCSLSFLSSLSRTLPALGGLEHRLRAAASSTLSDTSPYLADLLLVYERYAHFLEENDLFEPGWGSAPFRAGDSQWILLFPELAEDWDQYERELSASTSVEIVGLGELAHPEGDATIRSLLGGVSPALVPFGNAQDEIRWVTRTVRKLLDEGKLSPADIVLSVPRLEDWSDRLELEFRLFDIPIDIRSGKPLSAYPVGRLFSAMASCAGTRWSFRSLKDLLLDAAFPWKCRETIERFLDFGLRYRCVSGFPEDGHEVDVWERSFEHVRDHNIPEIRNFYRKLKVDILAIVKAPGFAQLRQKILEFKTNHFEAHALSPEIDALISRSLEELSDLAATETSLEGLRIENPFALFQSHLSTVPYVYQSEGSGVRVYKYRVAAGIAPAVHFVLNASQDAASVRADLAPFLREDYKLRIALEERDLSGPFFDAYERSGGTVLFSASKRDFRGFSFPHVELSGRCQEVKPEKCSSADPWATEVELALGHDAAMAAPASLQLTAHGSFLEKQGAALDLRRDPLPTPELRQRVQGKISGDTAERRISPTSLNAFYRCPFALFLGKGLSISERDVEIETIDQRDLGILYHRILERLFNRIKDSPGEARFRANHLPRYLGILDEEVDAALEEARQGEGAFQESVYAMLRTRIHATLRDFLEAVAQELDAAEIIGTEYRLRLEYPECASVLSGQSDLVLRKNGGGLIVIDFKTGATPQKTALLPDAENDLGDFQMAAYIRMLEKDGEAVESALFYSLDNRDFIRVLDPAGPKDGRTRLPVPRADYGGALGILDDAVEDMAGALESGLYPIPPKGQRTACAKCRFTAVCRATYAGGEK